jgi:ribosomal protein S18 acetylase RimI-like enzyme
VATGQDADAVVDLWTEAYVTRGVGGRFEPYAVADFLDSARHGEVFVAERHGRVVGTVVMFVPGAAGRVVAGPDEAELSRLAVAFSARRMGIGAALADFCEQRARAAGWSAIALWSRPGQVEAHHLYESRGFRRVPERDSVDAAGQGRLVFRLTLEPRCGEQP